mgnify:CR=1 FL=1
MAWKSRQNNKVDCLKLTLMPAVTSARVCKANIQATVFVSPIYIIKGLNNIRFIFAV